MLDSGFHKLFHPVIPNGRTWSKLGEYGEYGEHGAHGKYKKNQTDDLKQSVYIRDSKHLFGNQMTQNTLFYGFYADDSKTYSLEGHHPWSPQNRRT